MKRRFLEMFSWIMIGDGLLSLLDPRRHCLLWETGPAPCRELLDAFARRPGFTRAFGLAEALAGFWLATSQKPQPKWRMGR